MIIPVAEEVSSRLHSIRFLDVRTKALAYEWKTSLTTGGK